MITWFDDEIIPTAWFDSQSQLNGGFFDEELIYITLYPAIVLNTDGSLIYKNAGSGDNKIYLNGGQLFARLSATAGDKLLTLSLGQITAT